ncbi:unnamed protein product, partial [Prorocentrum cordatum]
GIIRMKESLDDAGVKVVKKNGIAAEPQTVGTAKQRIDEAVSVVVDLEAQLAEANAT